MKAYRTNTLIIGLTVAAVALLNGCKEDDYPVPTASSQAKFTYTMNVIDYNEGKAFEVLFTNQSILANTYLWDFGNGNTSTEENPTEIFTEQGDHTITLTITSDNDLHYNNLTFSVNIRMLLKETLLLETFDGEGENTLDTWLPEGWHAVDADGDELNWYWAIRQGEGHMRSQSWDEAAGPLTPDNWLITKEIDLTNIEEGVQVFLNFNVCPSANTEAYRAEHYGVFVSTTGTNPADFTEKVWEETILETMTNWVYEFREVELTQFAGQKIRVGFRHYEITDMDRIVIDNVEVFKKF
jgi:PKD repeat protein